MENISETGLSADTQIASKPATMPRWVPITGIAIISFILSGVMSAFMTLVNIGLSPNYLPATFMGWLLGFIVSFPVALVVVPLVIRWQMKQTSR